MRLPSLLFFLLLATGASAQFTSDTANVQFGDSTLHRFHDYNQAYRGDHFYSSKGNLFAVGTDLVYHSSTGVGFKLMPSAFGLLENTWSGNSGFPKRQVFTEVMYAMGLKKEQFFTVTHRQVINSKTAFALDFRKLKTEGYLTRQLTDVNHFSAAVERKEGYGRYVLNLKGSYEREMFHENGGIVDSLVVNNKDLSDKRLLDVNLPEAKNTRRIRYGEITNTWNFGRIDSVKRDTVMVKRVVAGSALWHRVRYTEHSWVYKDTLPGAYYSNYYFDPDSTNDKLLTFSTENYLGWKTLGNKRSGEKRRVLVSVNGKFEYISIFHNNTHRYVQNTILQGAAFGNGSGWRSNAAYVLNGNNQGDFFVSGGYGKWLADSSRFRTYVALDASYRSALPEFTWQWFYGNNYRWQNHFQKVNTLKVSFDCNIPKLFTLQASVWSISNLLYLNSDAHPQRYPENMGIVSLILKKDLSFRSLHFDNFICYQRVGDESVVNLPEFLSKNSLYVEGYIFKHAMNASLGLDLTYFSAYHGMAYSPALNQFYGQDSILVGNYPQVDFFISFKVKTLRAFVRADNINNYIMPASYYMVPRYPMPGTTVKFGVSWRFYN